MRVVIVSLLVAATAAAVSAASVPCTFAVTSPIKATYDLTALQSSDAAGWLSIDESNDGSGMDYYYRYNICNDLAAPPTTNPANLCANKAGNFYQIYNNTQTRLDTTCHLVSSVAGMNWSFVEDTNPMMGLQQHYGGGDSCTASADGERDILVTFECLTTGAEPKLGRVNEENTCDYELYIRSIHACPLECPRPNELLCSGHGVCGADDDLKAMRCFCNTGYGGADCSEESSGTSSGSSHANQVLVAFVIILTVALLGMAVVLYRKIKKLNADDSNYGQLQGGEGDAAPRRAAAAPVPAAATHSDDHAASSHLADAVAVNA